MQIAAELRPQSWEMPPGFRVLSEGASIVPFEMGGETLDWLVAPVQIPSHDHPIVWLRPLNARFASGFVVLRMNSEIPVVVTREYALEAPLTLLTVMRQQGRLARLLFLNERGESRMEGETARESLIFAPNGNASWCGANVALRADDATPFGWRDDADGTGFFVLSALDIWNGVQRLLRDANGEANFVRQFAPMNERAREQFVFDCAALRPAQFNSLMRDLMLSQEFWNDAQTQVQVQYPRDEKPRVDIFCGSRYVEMDAELERAVDLLWRRFLPVKEGVANYRCVVNWLRKRRDCEALALAAVSAHERLEAHLRWRDWVASVEDSPR